MSLSVVWVHLNCQFSGPAIKRDISQMHIGGHGVRMAAVFPIA